MTNDQYEAYLTLLRQLSKTLSDLSDIQKLKTQAVRQDDLSDLNECMKKEQVISLSLRGFEKKRMDAVAALGLESVSLSGLAARYPEAQRMEAKAVAEDVIRQYQIYRSAADVARSTLECNLHEIEKIIALEDGASVSGPGYQGTEPVPPPSMRTDIRA